MRTALLRLPLEEKAGAATADRPSKTHLGKKEPAPDHRVLLLGFPYPNREAPGLPGWLPPPHGRLYTSTEFAVKQKGLRKTAPYPPWVNFISLIRERAGSRRLIFT